MGSVAPATQTATIKVSVFDGTRTPLSEKVDVLFTIFDGFRKQIYRDFNQAASVAFRVPLYDGPGDNYTVLAYAGNYTQAGFCPLKVSAEVPEDVDLMLLPKHARFDFRAARWDALNATHPDWMPLLEGGAVDQAAARDRYTQVLEDEPETLASLLNILTAASQIQLPSGTPLPYFRRLVWDESMQRDRFFAFADCALLEQVRRAAKQGQFQRELSGTIFHPGATDSYKQVQFGEANLQLTFHENESRQIDGVECVMVESDIDYYRDPVAHVLLEVIANGITGNLTDPKHVYVLRWMAGRHAGVPEFNPPYAIV